MLTNLLLQQKIQLDLQLVKLEILFQQFMLIMLLLDQLQAQHNYLDKSGSLLVRLTCTFVLITIHLERSMLQIKMQQI